MKNTILYLIASTFLTLTSFGSKLGDSTVGIGIGQLEFEVAGLKFDDISFDINVNNAFIKTDEFGLDYNLNLLRGKLDGPSSTELSVTKYNFLVKPYYNLDSLSFFVSLGLSGLSSGIEGEDVLNKNSFIYGVGTQFDLGKLTFTPSIDFPNYGIPGEGFIYNLPLTYSLTNSIDTSINYEYYDFDSFTNSLGNADKVKASYLSIGVGYKF